MKPLLIEIGTEEIPAGYIKPALIAFSKSLTERLQQLRVDCGQARVYGTPRRLTVYVDKVAMRQHTVVSELTGPPEHVAFDDNRQPTVAARKFAEKAGVPISKLELKQTEKGRYLCARVTEKGKSTQWVLRQILPDIFSSIPFPKTMRWADQKTVFARPVHNLVVLLGERAVSVAFAGVKSGRYTFGHRFMSPGKIRLQSPSQYLKALEDAWVLADMDKRRSMMEKAMGQAVKQTGGMILKDPELVEENSHLVEYPEVVLGHFDEKFLEVPRQVLVTAMREHQRYFAVVDDRDDIMAHFIAINNTRARNMAVVAAGHERVLRARLEDARFFFHADLKTSMDQWVQSLKTVIFQAELGSVYDKTVRIQKLAGFFARALDLDDTISAWLDRAAFLCKADLVSHVVNEFPKLQGVMGRIYAERSGEPGGVAEAIEEHYRPVFSGGQLPSQATGAVLALADKIDTICGCFCLGLIPTGASDPYALRRQAIGIIQIAIDRGFGFSVSQVVHASIDMLASDKTKTKDIADEVCRFFDNRMAYLLEEKGISKDLAAAVISASSDQITDVWQRADALQKLKSERDFKSLAAAFKRVVNIIRKADPADTRDLTIKPELFSDSAEKALYKTCMKARQDVSGHISSGDMNAAFGAMAAIKPDVDAFFDSVLVMDDNSDIRRNRLALLQQISEMFARLADFSKIST
jgi:glycyl-tRNA synthetase beta chain